MQKVEFMLDDLAAMVQRGFTGVEKRLDGIDSRIDSFEHHVNRRFDDVQAQIDGIYVNYATMREHDLLKARVRVLEKKSGK